jgi:hypothetical protein
MGKKKQKKKLRKMNRRGRINKKNAANISEAIAAITNSFIENNNLDDSTDDLQTLIPLSVIAWNISLFPETNKETIYGQITEMLPKKFGAEGIAGFVSIIEKIIGEKKKLYPNVNRLIEKYDISVIDGDIKLDVQSIPFGERRK